MEHEQLLQLLRKYGSISTEEEINFKKFFKLRKIRKKEIILQENSSCNKLFFVNSGLLRAFYINNNGNEITRIIAWENRFLTNIDSFRNFSDNTEIFECIESGEILYILKEDFVELIKTFPNLKSIYTDILEEYTALNIQRFQQLNTLNPFEKLQYFRKNFPLLKNRINDNVLSSFLSMSRKTLERIK